MTLDYQILLKSPP